MYHFLIFELGFSVNFSKLDEVIGSFLSCRKMNTYSSRMMVDKKSSNLNQLNSSLLYMNFRVNSHISI
jgi:hypothetical protein